MFSPSRPPSRLPLPAVLLLLLLLFAWAGPLLRPVDPDALDLDHTLARSSPAHPLGTDESGRDLLARLMSGGRVSLAVGAVAAGIALGLGTLVGGLAGWRGGWLDGVLMRLTDAAMAVPVLFVALAVLSLLGTRLPLLLAVIGATSWMGIARLVRAQVAALREREFVIAARGLGEPSGRVFFRHLLPQLVPTLSVAASLGVAYAILTESALSFLGLGVQPPRASWGNMLTGAQHSLYAAPRLAIWPGVMILLTTLGCNGLGERLRRRYSVRAVP
jgi:peptide/nickel transport system permease protein